MHGLKMEYRQLDGKSLSRDLTTHLHKRSLQGKAVVVTDRPFTMLASVRKQWLRLTRKTQIEYARRLESERTPGLSGQLGHIQTLKFTAKAPEDILEADVTFATVEDFIRYAPDCPTMYITYDVPREKLYLITSWMPKSGLVVIYA